MVMVTEDYVSFETAKLLKEKGFNEDCRDSYDWGGNFHLNASSNNGSIKKIAAPTIQKAMKWLREVHKIYIVISPISGKGYSAILCDVEDFDDFNYIGETDYFFHPEEAVEAALKYSLENLI